MYKYHVQFFGKYCGAIGVSYTHHATVFVACRPEHADVKEIITGQLYSVFEHISPSSVRFNFVEKLDRAKPSCVPGWLPAGQI